MASILGDDAFSSFDFSDLEEDDLLSILEEGTLNDDSDDFSLDVLLGVDRGLQALKRKADEMDEYSSATAAPAEGQDAVDEAVQHATAPGATALGYP